VKIRPGYTCDAKTDDQLFVYRDAREIARCDGFFLHPKKKRLWFLDQVYWAIDASDREKLESAVWLTSLGVRIWWASKKDDFEFYKRVAKHGNLRKIGISHNLITGGSTMLWETVAK